MIIKTVGDLRKVISDLSDDYSVELRVRRRLSDEELKNILYPYPYETVIRDLEYDDIGVSDRVLCIGTEIPSEWSELRQPEK